MNRVQDDISGAMGLSPAACRRGRRSEIPRGDENKNYGGDAIEVSVELHFAQAERRAIVSSLAGIGEADSVRVSAGSNSITEKGCPTRRGFRRVEHEPRSLGHSSQTTFTIPW